MTILTAAGLTVLWEFVGPFVAIIWPVLWLSIGAHEFGHARCATKLGIDVPSVDIGAGPRLARFDNERITVTMRLIPIVGWTNIEEAESTGKAPAQLDRTHRRHAAVYLAGPTVSFAVGLLLCATGLVVAGNHEFGALVSDTVGLTGSIVTAPAQLMGSNVDWFVDLCSDDDTSRNRVVSDVSANSQATSSQSVEPSTIVGFTETSSDMAERYGFASTVVMIGVLNLDLAVMNMLPASGLDGNGFLKEIVEAIGARRRHSAKWLTICLRCVTVVATISIVLVIIRGLFNDLS